MSAPTTQDRPRNPKPESAPTASDFSRILQEVAEAIEARKAAQEKETQSR